jgi:single-stranded-DNA-specific exonuclease
MAGMSARARWTCSPYSVAAVDQLARELSLSPPVAAVLARRGLAAPPEARRFLAADERHDPFLFSGMGAVCDRVLEHVRRGSRIVVHGDYDVDGVTSIAILVRALRAVGADPHWFVPSRAEDGYGLQSATVERLAREGAQLLLTVDCGITCAAEVDQALAAGVDVIVTDHHAPGGRLPSCPILHPALGGYPFPELCAAAVAHKLACGLRRTAGLEDGEGAELDLVALATICDVVPLRGENRRIVHQGLKELARTPRPGLRALMRVAGIEAHHLDERDVAFRLGPRLNAAGRLARADAALELLMTEDEGRAAEVAEELNALNAERRHAETRVLFEAEPLARPQAHLPSLVVAGEGWHQGVLGIVASRIAERYKRPTVVLALDDETGRGSARSIPPFDLHAALDGCSRHLVRFGGHRAAAGLEIERARIPAFTVDLARHAAGALTPHDLVPVQTVDAVVPVASLGLELAEELGRLAPFGAGNPEPALLVPAVRLADVQAMGDEGQHARLSIRAGAAGARAVAFRTSPRALDALGQEQQDAVVGLELNEWRGVVEARPVVRALCATRPGRLIEVGGATGFWERLSRALPPAPAPIAEAAATRVTIDRRAEGVAAVAGELLASRERVTAVCADLDRRREGLRSVIAGLAPDGALEACEWDDLALRPDLAAPESHLLAIDPPTVPGVEGALPPGSGRLVLAWERPEVEFALAAVASRADIRPHLAQVYRALRDAGGGAAGSELQRILRGQARHARPVLLCARLLAVLAELDLAEVRVEAGSGACRLLDTEGTALERSPTFRRARHELEQVQARLAAELGALAVRRAA